MKLRYSPTSPYVRKAYACAIELQLDERIELISTDPWASDSDIGDDNPLGKVPALHSDDAGVLYDSAVICEYLDQLAGGGRLLPHAGPQRIAVLRRHALAHGMMDAAVNALMERAKRPGEFTWQGWIDMQLSALRRSLAPLAADLRAADGAVDLATITTGCALGYLDLRFAAELDWRAAQPELADWYADFSQRPSMMRSAPPAG